MKSFLILSLLISSSYTFARRGESLPEPWYEVVSVVKSNEVPDGQTRIKGKGMNGLEPISNAKISNFTGTHHTLTNEKGEYDFLIPAKDTSLFFYHPEYQEVVIWSYIFQAGTILTLNFHTMENYGEMDAVEKPVIYCYSMEPLHTNIQLEKTENLVYSYPEYNTGWHFELENNQMFDRATLKEFPYLFYESQSDDLDFITKDGFAEGDFVESGQVVDYLEATLTDLGLNDRESADFISYWGPRLSQKKYAFVQFIVDTEYDLLLGGLIVDPLPTSQRRVYILFQSTDLPLDAHTTWKQQKSEYGAEPLSRSGFTLIEWGGTELRKRTGL